MIGAPTTVEMASFTVLSSCSGLSLCPLHTSPPSTPTFEIGLSGVENREGGTMHMTYPTAASARLGRAINEAALAGTPHAASGCALLVAHNPDTRGAVAASGRNAGQKAAEDWGLSILEGCIWREKSLTACA